MCAMPALKRPAFLDGWSRSAASPGDGFGDVPDDGASEGGDEERQVAERAPAQGGPFRVVVSDSGEACFAQDFEAGEFLIGASPAADIIIPDLDEDEVASVRLESTGAACVVTPAPPLKQTLVEQIAPPAERMTSAAEGMRLALAAANLAPPVRVTLEEGRLVLTGSVTPDERARAFDVIASMRARSDLPVEVALAADPDAGMFVAAVFLEPAAFMVGRDGRRYAPGQRLPDGGVLEALDETSALVNRDGVRERLYYSR
jgi:hypothetical protein